MGESKITRTTCSCCCNCYVESLDTWFFKQCHYRSCQEWPDLATRVTFGAGSPGHCLCCRRSTWKRHLEGFHVIVFLAVGSDKGILMTDKKGRLRQILTMMPLRPIRSLRTPQANHGTFQPDQVCIHTYTNGVLQFPWSANLTAEKVCIKSADACNVPPLTANLFGLFDATKGRWMCPATRIEQPAPGEQVRLVFRLRYHTSATSPSGESSGFLQLEESVVNYMFCQYRERFLQDDIRGLSTEESLGLVVLDFMQYVKHENIPLANLNGRLRFGRFLPKSLNDGLSWWDKRKLRRKVKTALTDFREDSREAFAFKVMFLVSLSEEMQQDWGSEQFKTVSGDVYEVSGVKGVQLVRRGCGVSIPSTLREIQRRICVQNDWYHPWSCSWGGGWGEGRGSLGYYIVLGTHTHQK